MGLYFCFPAKREQLCCRNWLFFTTMKEPITPSQLKLVKLERRCTSAWSCFLIYTEPIFLPQTYGRMRTSEQNGLGSHRSTLCLPVWLTSHSESNFSLLWTLLWNQVKEVLGLKKPCIRTFCWGLVFSVWSTQRCYLWTAKDTISNQGQWYISVFGKRNCPWLKRCLWAFQRQP